MPIQIHKNTWNIAIGVLVVALIPLPIGFFMLVRLLVTGIAAYLAYQSFKNEKYLSPNWGWTFVVIAVLFNPVFTVALGRGLWMGVDIIVAIIFFVHKSYYYEPEVDDTNLASTKDLENQNTRKNLDQFPSPEMQEMYGKYGTLAAQSFTYMSLKNEYPGPDGKTNIQLDIEDNCQQILNEIKRLLLEQEFLGKSREERSQILSSLAKSIDPSSDDFDEYTDAAVGLIISIDWVDRIYYDYQNLYPNYEPLLEFVNNLAKVVPVGMRILSGDDLNETVRKVWPSFSLMFEQYKSSDDY